MSQTVSIPVRLQPAVVARLDELAEQHGMSRSALIKICLSSFLDQLEAKPLSQTTLEYFAQQLALLDGRTHRYQRMSDEDFDRQLAAALQRPEDKAKTREKAG